MKMPAKRKGTEKPLAGWPFPDVDLEFDRNFYSVNLKQAEELGLIRLKKGLLLKIKSWYGVIPRVQQIKDDGQKAVAARLIATDKGGRAIEMDGNESVTQIRDDFRRRNMR
jgi:hypothetical protein